MPSVAASSAALTARSMERRSTPGMAAMGVRFLSPSMRKSGQIRSSVESVFSRTSLRVQSERRLRRSLVAGKPARAPSAALKPLRLARSVLSEMGLSFGAATLVLTSNGRPASYHPCRKRSSYPLDVVTAILIAKTGVATRLHVEMEVVLVRLVGGGTERRAEHAAGFVMHGLHEEGFALGERLPHLFALRR